MPSSKQLQRLSAHKKAPLDINDHCLRGETTGFSLRRTSGRHTRHAALQTFLGEGDIQHHNRPSTFPASNFSSSEVPESLCVSSSAGNFHFLEPFSFALLVFSLAPVKAYDYTLPLAFHSFSVFLSLLFVYVCVSVCVHACEPVYGCVFVRMPSVCLRAFSRGCVGTCLCSN